MKSGIETRDTIAAVSTPRGSGGIAVLRLSGESAVAIAAGLYAGPAGLDTVAARKVCVGKFYAAADREELLDEVVAVVYRAPHSYTAEDVVEISCHGGAYLTARILQALLDGGARPARPGEFTERAFLNGRLDLSQAEAVADMIASKTRASLRSAVGQYQGVVSDRIRSLRKALVDTCSLLELGLDFAEEDVAVADTGELVRRIAGVEAEVSEFIGSYRTGRILREGVKLVIVGVPNVGKSSLLNALLREERAIVTELPGTTRDTLEEQLDIRGYLFRVVDTAGVRQTEDVIEESGVDRTYGQIESADVVALVLDGARSLAAEDRQLIAKVTALRPTNAGADVVVVNKVDLPVLLDPVLLSDEVGGVPVVKVSALQGAGMEDFEEALLRFVCPEADPGAEGAMITNVRHKRALELALPSLARARETLNQGLSPEFAAVDLHEAIRVLGEIIGEVTEEDILGNIFANFCIGK